MHFRQDGVSNLRNNHLHGFEVSKGVRHDPLRPVQCVGVVAEAQLEVLGRTRQCAELLYAAFGLVVEEAGHCLVAVVLCPNEEQVLGGPEPLEDLMKPRRAAGLGHCPTLLLHWAGVCAGL